ncbi:hypothetical protein ABTX60_06830 [Streptomyces sp. NPDC126510]|uniref:hypothetical protein n=1 Tax=Streptomyces sp. NPDC126510 TaxID=3155317 RepID=UPI0033228709
MNSHYRYSRALATGALCSAIAGIAVAAWSTVTFGLDDGYLLPVLAFLYVSAVLAWASKRERAAGRRAARKRAGRAAAEGFAAGLRHGHAVAVGPTHGGPPCFGPTGDWLCVKPAGDGHLDCVPFVTTRPMPTTSHS